MHASSSGNASSTSTRLALGLLNFTTCAGLNHLPSHHTPSNRLCQVCKFLFFYVKQMFGYGKVRYRSLGKNENRLALLLGFANLLRAESCMV